MEFRHNIWFAPGKIMHSYFCWYHEHKGNVKNLPDYKIITETTSTAIMIFGIQKIQKRDYWLQLVDPKELTPDVRTASHVKELGNFPLYYQDVEVVTYEEHSTEDLAEFLKRTKLSPLKAYQEKTIVLCMINKSTQTESWEEIAKKLSTETKDVIIYALGRTDPKELKYQLACIYPKLQHVIKFDVSEEMQKDRRGSMKFIRGTIRQEKKTDELYEPF